MNLEDIKEFRNFVDAYFQDEVATYLPKYFDWLLYEVERLQNELKRPDLKAVCAYDSGQRAAAMRCAEIAASTIEANIEKSIGTYPIVFGERSAEAIRKEFKL